MSLRILRSTAAAFVLGCLPAAAPATTPPGAAAPARPPGAPRSPVPLPRVAGLKNLVLAAHVDLKSADPAWEVALMEVDQKPSMQAIATGSGGYVDSLAGKPAAWSGNGALC